MIHRRCDGDRRLGSKAERRQKIRGTARRQPGHDLRRRRRDQNQVRPARQLYVPHRGLCFLVPQVVSHRQPGDGLQRGLGNKLAGAAGEHDLDLDAATLESANECRCLVGSDAARHTENDPGNSHKRRPGFGSGSLARLSVSTPANRCLAPHFVACVTSRPGPGWGKRGSRGQGCPWQPTKTRNHQRHTHSH